MIATLRRIITQIFGSAQVEQVDLISRTGAELAARRGETRAGIVGQASLNESRSGERSVGVGASQGERRP